MTPVVVRPAWDLGADGAIGSRGCTISRSAANRSALPRGAS